MAEIMEGNDLSSKELETDTSYPTTHLTMPTTVNDGTSTQANFPSASLRAKGWSQYLWWLVPICSLGACIALFYYTNVQEGIRLKIEFRDGHGLKPQDVVKHKGIVVGEVEKIELSDSLEHVVATVRLTPSARSLAKEGSRFWIVRPNVSVDSIGGLDTILGAKYLGVSPGPLNAASCYEFVGLDYVPIVAPKSGSLEIVLDSPHRSGLLPNAPILYRGYTVGRVLDINLASDARSVRARCSIDPEYKNLVRSNSKFWKQAGWQLSVGITGIKIDGDTLPQLLTGSIQMATPSVAGNTVENGATFELHQEADPDWLSWSPGIAGGVSGQGGWHDIPEPISLSQTWKQSWFGIKSEKHRQSWLLVLEDGSVLGLSSQFAPPANALAESLRLQIDGNEIATSEIKLQALGGTHNEETVVLANLPKDPSGNSAIPSSATKWPKAMLSLVQESTVPRNVIIPQPLLRSSVWVDAARLQFSDNAWAIHSSVPVSSDMHGLPAIDADTKQIVGVLTYDESQKTCAIVLIDPTKIAKK